MRAHVPYTWLDQLDEGVLLIERWAVQWLNLRAAEMLEVDRDRSLGAPLISVLRDHRLERVALERKATEVTTRGRTLLARPVDGGLVLLDVSEAKRSHEGERALLAVLSHELRTPATAVSAALEALRYDLDEVQRERFVKHAQAESARLVRLIEDLTVDSTPPRERTLELRRLVERASGIAESLYQGRGVELQAEVPDLLLWADEDKLLQVLLNLLENAALHGPSDATVTVAAGEGAGMVTVRVRDLGAPLPRDAVEGLFQPHARGGRGSGKGSGLGLYIVRSIVERWGGRVWWSPAAGGNEFSFTVPSAAARTGGA